MQLDCSVLNGPVFVLNRHMEGFAQGFAHDFAISSANGNFLSSYLRNSIAVSIHPLQVDNVTAMNLKERPIR